MALGTLLGVIDLAAGRHQAAGHWRAFAFWYVVGVALLQVGGNFAEMSASLVGNLLLCVFVSQVLVSQRRVRTRAGSRGGAVPSAAAPRV